MSLILDRSLVLFPAIRLYDRDAWAHVADRYVRHEFDILGSGWVRVHYGMTCQGFEGNNYSDTGITAESVRRQLPPAFHRRSAELLQLARQFVPDYTPIDWHIDFKSGYRYGLVHHKQLKYGFLDGVDAKVSADLSRCYHLVVLALAWRATGVERYRQEVLAQILDWLAFNPFEYGAAWRANMNVAIRAANWIVAFSLIRDSLHIESRQDRAFLEAFQNSIVDHRRYIAENLEFPEDHFHPNHYIANLTGLFVVCRFCSKWDSEALAWYNLALRELRIELDRQVLADGFSYESATSYHALVLEMISYALILAAHAEGEYQPAGVRNWIENGLGQNRLGKLRKMFIALRDITQPNGLIPLVGDTDDGRFLYLETPHRHKRDWRFLSCVGAALFDDSALLAETVSPWDWTVAQLLLGAQPCEDHPTESKCALYPNVGFYIMRGPGFYSLISCGPIGTDGKGGHCHNDKLSLTLCVDGREVLIDPGVYVYTASKRYRDLYRSVFSHNTVVLADQEQNRFLDESPWWGCHEDTCCKCIRCEDSPERTVFIGQHEGYLRLDTAVLHRRQIVWQKRDRKMIITDEMIKQDSAKPAPPMQWTFMLHPECQIASIEEQIAVVERGGLQLEFLTSSGRWQASTGFYSPSYGIKQVCPRLTIHYPVGVAENTVIISW